MHLAELVAVADCELTLEIERRARLIQATERLEREPAIADSCRRQLDVGPAILHYCVYLVSTIALRMMMGMNAMWDVPLKP